METRTNNLLDEIAETSGLAVVVLDETGRELSASNNNSICSVLYPSAEFGPKCAEFCGKAFSRSFEARETIEYRCHAGLYCKATPLKNGDQKLVAILGRIFTKADNYRQITERAINGDLRQFPPDKLFENVLIAGSDDGFKTVVEKLDDLSSTEAKGIFYLAQPVSPTRSAAGTDDDILGVSHLTAVQARPVQPVDEQILDLGSAIDDRLIGRPREITEWRSVFGSFFSLDYAEACATILRFLSERYDLPSLLWLERRGDRLESMTSLGELTERSVKIAIPADEPRLTAAIRDGMQLELIESGTGRSAKDRRTISLFPVAIGGDIRAVLAVGGTVEQELAKHLTHFCRTVASQMEILRLRDEVTRRDSLSTAVAKFNENLQKIDGVDFWLHLTQVSAELLRAERASLLLLKGKTDILRPMASIGIGADLSVDSNLGNRVARLTLEGGKPVLVKDVNKINFKLAPAGRRYKTGSFISYPIMIGDRDVAVLNLTDKAGGAAFNERDLEVLRAITPQIAVAIDRSDLREQAGVYAQLSVTDSLTGLLNRRYLETRLAEEISRSDRHSYPMSFMMLDVDEFKSYNDLFGHPAGDEALKMVGNIIREAVRGADVAARYGGEEFAVLLPQTTAEETETIAERLRQTIEEAPFAHRKVTVSIGIASCYPTPSSSTRDLISAADKALYRAKQKGRNNVQSFGDLKTSVENVH